MSNPTLLELILADFGTDIKYPFDYIEQKVDEEREAKDADDYREDDSFTEQNF